MKAGHGRHPQTAGATPRALPSGAGPHPAEDKEPEQEFVPGLVSRQGFVIPALSGMCWALGKFPAGSREQRGSSHLARGAAAPHPAGCSVPPLQLPLLPRLGSPGQAAPGAAGILRVFLPRRCPEGTGTFQLSVSRGGWSGIAAPPARAATNQIPGAPVPSAARGSAMPRDLGGF